MGAYKGKVHWKPGNGMICTFVSNVDEVGQVCTATYVHLCKWLGSTVALSISFSTVALSHICHMFLIKLILCCDCSIQFGISVLDCTPGWLIKRSTMSITFYPFELRILWVEDPLSWGSFELRILLWVEDPPLSWESFWVEDPLSWGSFELRILWVEEPLSWGSFELRILWGGILLKDTPILGSFLMISGMRIQTDELAMCFFKLRISWQ